MCLLVSMSNALLIVGSEQRSLKNTENLVSSSSSHSEVRRKVKIVYSTLLSLFKSQIVYFGHSDVHSYLFLPSPLSRVFLLPLSAQSPSQGLVLLVLEL